MGDIFTHHYLPLRGNLVKSHKVTIHNFKGKGSLPTKILCPHRRRSHVHDDCVDAINSLTMSNSTTTYTALEALASLASKRSTLSEDTAAITPHQTSSDDEKPSAPCANELTSTAICEPNVNDYESRLLVQELPSYPTRTAGRLRSASNPEGMEKWDSYSRSNDRRHFVLPSSILEEELASTRKVLGESEGSGKLSSHVSGFQFTNYSYYSKGKVQEFTMLTPGKNDEGGDVTTTNNYSTTNGIARRKRQIKQPSRFGDVQVVLGVNSNFTENHSKSSSGKKTCKKKIKSNELDNDEVDESLLEPDELLKRARSKLLEDLSEENGEEEKGGLILPHSLSKYHEVS